MENYIYSIVGDFPNQVISATCLDAEILASSIVTVLEGTHIENDEVSVRFLTALTAGEESTLNTLVANHNHNCPENQEQEDEEESVSTPLSVQEDDVEVSDITNIINFEGGVDVTDDGNGKVTVTVDGDAGVFGHNAINISDESESSASSTSYIDKLDYTTEVLPIGTYRVACYAEGIISNSSHEYIIRGLVDSTEILTTSGNDVGNDNIWKGNSGFIYVTFTSSETHNLKLQWKSSHHRKTASIRRARIELWRVS